MELTTAPRRPTAPEDGDGIRPVPRARADGDPHPAAGHDGAATVRLLGEIDAATKHLQEINAKLASLIPVLRPTSAWRRWWDRLTGKRLERQVFLREICIQAERLADQGVADSRRAVRQVEALSRHRRALRQQQQMLDHEILVARQRLSSPAADLDPEEGQRLSRRLALQEALTGTLRATQLRCRTAARGAREACAAFEEVLALLRLRWKQRLGFELFSRRLAPSKRKPRGPSRDARRRRARE